MSPSNHLKIRALLRQNADGLTTLEIAAGLGIKRDIAQQAVRKMPDTYIDRWQVVPHEPPHAVWCAVVPPEDCPKPRARANQSLTSPSMSKPSRKNSFF
jgi:hypothetical protein